jgi:xylulokinase
MSMVSNSYLIGIDAGTTSIKGVLLSEKGDLIASAGQEYMLESGTNDTCEIDPEVYWRITCLVIGEIIQKSAINPTLIKGIAFSSQGETLIVVDKDGEPLRKAIVWLDNRSGEEAREITDQFGNQRIMEITGQPEVVAIWPATRILWLKKNEPDVFSKAYKYLLVEDFLIFKLTGLFCTEHSLVSSTLYFDITRKIWWDDMLSFIGITKSQLPEVEPSGSVVGYLTEDAARSTGLVMGTSVVAGAYDHPSGAIGAGNIAPGMATLTIGASMAMCVTLEHPVSDLSLKLSCQCHAIPGLYFLLPYSQTAGLVLKWFKDEFCSEEVNTARQLDADPYSFIVEQAAQISPGANGLTMLPHLMGTGSPEFNPKVKGVFAGITLGMKKGHFIRAILESVVATIERNLQLMEQKGIHIREIHVLGGGAKNDLWNQILADMTGIPVVTMSQQENASIGAAILAGIGTGIFTDISSACKSCNCIVKVFEPDITVYETYRQVYQRYVSLYESLVSFWG